MKVHSDSKSLFNKPELYNLFTSLILKFPMVYIHKNIFKKFELIIQTIFIEKRVLSVDIYL